MPFVNGLLKKKGLQDLVGYCFLAFGNDKTVQMLDEMKEVSFYYATKAGVSIGIDDMVVPLEKERMIDDALTEVIAIEKQRSAGVITAGERHNKIIDIWHRVTESVSEEMFQEMAARGREAWRVQPDPHDGRLRRPWLPRAGAPAGRHARSDVQAFGRGHRDAHHRQLPRRPDGAPVLHLHPRRA